ncbi:hypothetical protein MATL_G00227010 [Megalops atlanticus]|uniref:Uncharacterized protein n=1 Tax=Megalops atlanticus TaxID=7932 RepID=A0A9D3PFF1_MEGAT|nr:hypothetical protein MATL_G00227010 [Megalops atlanticus]
MAAGDRVINNQGGGENLRLLFNLVFIFEHMTGHKVISTEVKCLNKCWAIEVTTTKKIYRSFGQHCTHNSLFGRQEVVRDKPMITEFKIRWPGLFTVAEVEAEFVSITTAPLVSKFLAQLDHHTAQLVKVFKKKGGSAGRKIAIILAPITQSLVGSLARSRLEARWAAWSALNGRLFLPKAFLLLQLR